MKELIHQYGAWIVFALVFLDRLVCRCGEKRSW